MQSIVKAIKEHRVKDIIHAAFSIESSFVN